MTLSVQQRVLAEIVAHFRGVKAGLPANDPYEFQWERVHQREFSSADEKLKSALSILFSDVTPLRLLHCYENTMSVSVEFRIWGDGDEDAEQTMQRAFGEIVRRALELHGSHPLRPSGTILTDIDISGMDPTIGDEAATIASGFVYLTVKFRHAPLDPRVNGHG